jgi:hypothetical protein
MVFGMRDHWYYFRLMTISQDMTVYPVHSPLMVLQLFQDLYGDLSWYVVSARWRALACGPDPKNKN